MSTPPVDPTSTPAQQPITDASERSASPAAPVAQSSTVVPALAAAGITPELVAELRGIAEQIAREAGELVRASVAADRAVAATKSSSVDVVTATDLASERLLRSLLARLRPDDGIVGEEEDSVRGTSGLTWVLDPIDGTVNFLYGVPAYAISVAVVAGEPDPAVWEPVAGCVHCVPDGRTWTAGRGQGATLDGQPVTVNAAADLSSSLVGTGFGYTVERRTVQAGVVASLLPLVRDIRRIGAASLDLCGVATGTLDAYYERGLKPWDLAAGGLVATEAGATLRGLRGERAGEQMVVVGPEPTATALADLLARWDADKDATR